MVALLLLLLLLLVVQLLIPLLLKYCCLVSPGHTPTPTIVFSHLPPDSARIGYWVLIRLWKQYSVQART